MDEELSEKMNVYDHFHDENENYYPEVIIVFIFLLFAGCIAGAALMLLIYSIRIGLYA
jgi:hypothetical protein